MAIPDNPLKLTVDPDALTLDDLELFESFSVRGLKAFIAQHSNWTPAEIGALTVKELRDVVGPAIGAALKDSAVPKGTPSA